MHFFRCQGTRANELSNTKSAPTEIILYMCPANETWPHSQRAHSIRWDHYSVSPIYRGRVYRGIGYIAVACWTPFFCPPISRILQTWCPRAQYFREIAVTPCIQFAGDNFSRNLLTAIAFVPVRWRQFFAKSTRAYLSMRAGTHAVRWAATLGGALTPPLCRRVGSS